MNLQIVSELVKMMENSSLTAMEVEQGGLRVRLENGKRETFVTGTSAQESKVSAPYYASSTAESTSSGNEAQSVEIEEKNPQMDEPVGSKEIVSPMVGTYHDLATRVVVGSKLKKGDPVCIIEAMKVMNEIVMEEDGEITWVAAIEGEMVEYGQLLFMFD